MKSYNFYFKSILILSFLLVALIVQGQSILVSGTVTDAADGFGLPGVNVTVKNGEVTSGTITEVDGTYSLKVEQGAVIEFSYTGYANQEFVIEESKRIDVALTTADALLDEVVVIGYGAVRKEDVTGVVTKVGEEEFNIGVIPSPDKLLVGKVAGLQISTNGEPGGASLLKIRGGTALDGSGGQALIVIDGVPLDNSNRVTGRNPLNFINAADVEDVTVLKDASAAAIYGSRGANGVIVITTKTGKGKLKVNYSGYYSISTLRQRPNIFSSDQFRRAIDSKAPAELARLGAANTDWIDEVTQLASGQQHNLSISGAYKKIGYHVSFNHLFNNGVLNTSKNTISRIGVNLSSKLLNDNLIINFRNKTSWNRDQIAPGVMNAAIAFDPTQPVFDDNSVYGGYFQWGDVLATSNPVSTLALTDNRRRGTRSLNALDVEYKLPFIEGLSFKTNLSYDLTKGDQYNLRNPLLFDSDNFNRGGSLFTEEEEIWSKLLETYFSYNKELPGIKSKINATLGYSWQEFDTNRFWESGNRLQAADNEFNYMATEDLVVDSFLTTNRLISFFSRINYTYDDKYLLTVSLRRDGSSRFGPSNRWGFFPAVALGWRVLQEDFAKGALSNIFTDLKVRLSYGVTGNQEIGDYLYETFYSYGTGDAAYQFGDQFVQTLRGTGVDPAIKWEETSSINFGIDFGVWNNRFTGSIDLYQKNTRDLLFSVATAAFTNLSDRVTTNISELENKGIELALSTYVIDREDWDWKLNFNASYNQSLITKLDNSNLPEFGGYETGGISGDIGQNIQIIKVGESVGSFRAYKHILDANGNPIDDTFDRDGNGQLELIDMYEDLNGDGIINENDLGIEKNSVPDFMFGLTSNLSYKNFDLAFTLRAQLGNYVYNNVASSTGFFDRLSDRVPNNTSATSFETNFKTRQLKSDYYIEDASFLRLDNITLGYTLNEIPYLRNVRFYTTVQNIMTITGYSGVDPEAPQFNNGIDNNVYPASTTFLFGLNASF
ncbi:MAG: SusC/RagA family TonB-linked outer membrane protein [Saprospiraceae bacterium]